MVEQNKRYISGKILFPLIEEQLGQGRNVRFTVSGTSMMPWIVNNRDEVEVVSVKDIELKKGDIILFQPLKNKYVLHRIIQIYPYGYLTAGDGNLYVDGIISVDSVIAKVISIKRKGKIINCDSLKWKCIFRLWMLLFPVRKYLLKSLSISGRIKKKVFKV